MWCTWNAPSTKRSFSDNGTSRGRAAETIRATRSRLSFLDSPYRFVISPIVAYILDLEKQNPDRQIAVIIPELVEKHWYQYFLHNQRASWLKGTPAKWNAKNRRDYVRGICFYATGAAPLAATFHSIRSLLGQAATAGRLLSTRSLRRQRHVFLICASSRARLLTAGAHVGLAGGVQRAVGREDSGK